MTKNYHKTMKKSHTGSFLIEILISLFLLSSVLMGIQYMQLKSLMSVKKIFFRSIAMNQMQNLVDDLLHQPDEVSNMINDWNKDNQSLLPNGHAKFEKAFPGYRIQLFWNNTSNECHQQGESCLNLTIKETL